MERGGFRAFGLGQAEEEAQSVCFNQTNCEIQLTADNEGQLCNGGSEEGEVQEEMINTSDLQVLRVSDALWK